MRKNKKDLGRPFRLMSNESPSCVVGESRSMRNFILISTTGDRSSSPEGINRSVQLSENRQNPFKCK